jgi:hypothetical protein
MNYAAAVAGAIAVFAFGWWWAGARHVYTGPKTKDLLQQIATEEGLDDHITDAQNDWNISRA